MALTALAMAAVVWSAASSPWQVVIAAPAVATLCTGVGPAMLLGLAGVFGGVWVRWRRRDLAELRAGSVGLGLLALTSCAVDPFPGASSLLVAAVGAGVTVTGVRRRPRAVRRRFRRSLLAALAVLGVGAAAGSVAGAQARGHLEAGRRAALAGLDDLEHGRLEDATAHFQRAQRSLARANRATGGPLARAGWSIPVLGQHLRVAEALASTGTTSLGQLADALSTIDLGRLQISHGQLDIPALTQLDRPLGQMAEALDALGSTLERERTRPLAPSVRRPLDDLAAAVGAQRQLIASTRRLLAIAPDLLGQDAERRYLVLFTSPSEARGLGGSAGNFAELRIRDGALTVPRFGRISELRAELEGHAIELDQPVDALEVFGSRGLRSGAGGTVDPSAWTHITAPPHFPDVAELAAALYPASGGRRVDGVVVADPAVLATLLKLTGPLEVESPGQQRIRLNSQNAFDFVVRDQYLVGQGNERIDLLDRLARATLDRVLDSSLPTPLQVVADLARLVAERRLLMWSPQPSERSTLDEIGLLGALPDPTGGRGWAVTVDNLANNELDTYLVRTVRVRSRRDHGPTFTEGEVVLTNAAPAQLPRGVSGNDVGLPDGWSRHEVAIYTTGEPIALRVDGRSTGIVAQKYHGWWRTNVTIELAPGGSLAVQVTAREQPGVGPDDPILGWEQPLVIAQAGP